MLILKYNIQGILFNFWILVIYESSCFIGLPVTVLMPDTCNAESKKEENIIFALVLLCIYPRVDPKETHWE